MIRNYLQPNSLENKRMKQSYRGNKVKNGEISWEYAGGRKWK